MPDPIYLDYNATTPLAPEVVAAMLPFLEQAWGNPSSSHVFGRRARLAIDQARGQLAALLGCGVDELVFTGGGTEANNMAIQGVAYARRERGRHIVTSAVEHPAVSQVCAWLASLGWEISTVGVDAHGRVDPGAVAAALRPDTVLVSVMHANNEVGTLQPIAEIAAIARERGVIVHCDGAQAVGKIPTDVRELGVDLYSVAGHKLYAPKGVGALYIRRGTPLAKVVHGAGHEAGRRPGTENTLGIVGLGAAAALAMDAELGAAILGSRRDHLLAAIHRELPDIVVHGHPVQRLPNTLSLGFPGVQSLDLLELIADRVAASAGAACHAGGVSISSTLRAMGVGEALALGTVRFSVGHPTTAAELEAAADTVVAGVRHLRTH
jgi:cysteine desulfurase